MHGTPLLVSDQIYTKLHVVPRIPRTYFIGGIGILGPKGHFLTKSHFFYINLPPFFFCAFGANYVWNSPPAGQIYKKFHAVPRIPHTLFQSLMCGVYLRSIFGTSYPDFQVPNLPRPYLYLCLGNGMGASRLGPTSPTTFWPLFL